MSSEPVRPKIAVRSLSKSFGDHLVLDGIDLDVAAGEVVALIGASGSGKSTLLRCLNLLEPIDDGAVMLDGEDISVPGYRPDGVRRRVGMVFQSYNLFPHMTVLDNVALAPRNVLGRPRSEVCDQAMTLLGRFGLADRAGAYPDRLSGGQQQRVAIVRALALDPEVLLLDEITSALDPELVGEVLDAVRELSSTGMTLVLATHEMGFAREVSDKVAMLDAGRIVEQGPPEQIFGSPHEERTRSFLTRVREAGRG